MGDRALVIFKSEGEVSPTVYTHWHGYLVPEMIERLAKAMGGRLGDVPYSTARFIQIATSYDPDNNLSFGVWNTEQEVVDAVVNDDDAAIKAISYGDNGVFVVDVSTFEVKRYDD